MNAVTTKPSNQKRSLREAKDKYAYIWLMHREPPDPAPYERIIQSDRPVPEFGAAGEQAALQKYDGTSFRTWRIVAVLVNGKLTSGQADLDVRYKFHDVEDR
jgi:hypothetical protein